MHRPALGLSPPSWMIGNWSITVCRKFRLPFGPLLSSFVAGTWRWILLSLSTGRHMRPTGACFAVQESPLPMPRGIWGAIWFSPGPAAWPRLAVSPSPLSQELQALTASAWPKALHGVSATSLSNDTFATLRAGASRGLGFDRPGLSSKVLLSFCCFPMADPQFFAIVSTFRDLRAFADPCTFVPVVEQLLSLSKWPPGPAQVFLERCHALGWAWCSEGHCLRDAISAFNPWLISPQELLHRLVYAWQVRVGSELDSRSGFSGMSRVDAALTNRLLKGWSECDRLNVRLAQSGAFFTQDALHHFSQDPADSLHCRFCGQPDSVQHRLWSCGAFADCRDQCRAFELPDPATDLPVQFLRGWALRPARQLELWQALACS